jgi:hypothetical protein
VYAAPKPSVPQFSLKLIDNSYDTPPSSTTNSYTGVTTTKPGYHVYNRSIEVTIKNQPFTPYTDANGNKIDLYYRIEFKGHFGNDTEWNIFRSAWYQDSSHVQSKSGYTVVSHSIEEPTGSSLRYPDGSQLDFRVEAFTGHWVERTAVEHVWGLHDPYVAYDELSGYSIIQTITITSGSSSTTPSQTATVPPPYTTFDYNQTQSSDQTQQPYDIFTQPFFLLVVSVLFGVVVAAIVIGVLRRHIKTSDFGNDFPQVNVHRNSCSQ